MINLYWFSDQVLLVLTKPVRVYCQGYCRLLLVKLFFTSLLSLQKHCQSDHVASESLDACGSFWLTLAIRISLLIHLIEFALFRTLIMGACVLTMLDCHACSAPICLYGVKGLYGTWGNLHVFRY